MNKIKSLILFFTGSFLVLFQNCSDVSFSPKEISLANDRAGAIENQIIDTDDNGIDDSLPTQGEIVTIIDDVIEEEEVMPPAVEEEEEVMPPVVVVEEEEEEIMPPPVIVEEEDEGEEPTYVVEEEEEELPPAVEEEEEPTYVVEEEEEEMPPVVEEEEEPTYVVEEEEEEMPPVAQEEEPVNEVDQGEEVTIVELATINSPYASIAFEDNVNKPNWGDKDYNDAVINFNIKETYNSMKQLTAVDIELRVRANLAGNNHRLYLYFNGNTGDRFTNISHISSAAFNGLADMKLETPSGYTQMIENANHVKVIASTKNTVGKIYKLHVDVKSPELNQVAEIPAAIDFKKYRFILQNHGQNLGIDIAEINSSDEMLAGGYPLGFMIPTDWEHPKEGQYIGNKYPNFKLYKEWLAGDQSTQPSTAAAFWFLDNPPAAVAGGSE